MMPESTLTVPRNTTSSKNSPFVALKALRRSYKLFKDSVDPDYFATVLYSNLLLTREEHEKAIHRTATDSEKLKELLKALERRISADPNVFDTVLQALKTEPALEAVVQEIKGEPKLLIRCNTIRFVFAAGIYTEELRNPT